MRKKYFFHEDNNSKTRPKGGIKRLRFITRTALLILVYITQSFAGEGFISGSWRFDLDINLQKLKKLGTPYYIFSIQDSLLSFNVAGEQLLKDNFKYTSDNINGNHYLKVHESRLRYANLYQSFSVNWKNVLFGLELGKHSKSQNIRLNDYSWEEYVVPADSIADPKHIISQKKESIKSNFIQGKFLYRFPRFLDNLDIRVGLTYKMLNYKKRDSVSIFNGFKEIVNFLGTLRYDVKNIHGYIVTHKKMRSYATAIIPMSNSVTALHYDDLFHRNIRLFYFYGSNSDIVEEQVMMRQDRLYNAMLLNTQNDLVEQAMYDYPIFLKEGWYVSVANIKNQENPKFEFGAFVGGFIGLHASHGDEQTSFSIVSPVGSLTFADVDDRIAIIGNIFFHW